MGQPGPRHVILLGFMGSGKTTVGRLIAERMGLPFVDTDRCVGELAGMTIPEIFDRAGEETFRSYETRALRHALDGPPSIIATGGGIVTREENWPLMTSRGVTVWLRVGFDTLRRRLADSKDRPLLSGDTTWERTRRLYLQREPLYRRAAAWVDGEQPAEVVADTVIKAVGSLPDARNDRVE